MLHMCIDEVNGISFGFSGLEEIKEVMEGDSSVGVGAALGRQCLDHILVDRQVDLPAHTLQLLLQNR